MAINDLPVLSALRTKMQWHQERQRVLAENISNSDTPNFKPSDLVEPKFDRNGANPAAAQGSLAMMRTSASHIAPAGGGGDSFAHGGKPDFRTARRQRRQSRGPDAQGLRQPDGLRRGHLALQPQSRLLKTAIGKR
jgi:flagellar basal-body rod protein FlgB